MVIVCVDDIQSDADRDVSRSCISVALLNTHTGFTCEYYRVSIKSFPDYIHLLQENYMEYKHIFFYHYLTLRRLMSYIYMEHPFLMFLDHTRRRSTVGRTPLDE